MGACSSSQFPTKDGEFTWKTTVSIVHLDGRLQQFNKPIKAEHVLSQNPKCFLCNSESMHVGSLLPHVKLFEELHLGHIYFLFPLTKSHIPLSLKCLCALAIKANAALVTKSMVKSCSVLPANRITRSDTRILNLPREHEDSIGSYCWRSNSCRGCI